MLKPNHSKKIEKANLQVESALGVFRKAQNKVMKAIGKLESVVEQNDKNILEYQDKIREEEENKNQAISHINEHKSMLEKFSNFLP